MSSDMIAQVRFLLTDVVQLLKLILIISMPVAVVVGVGAWVYVKRIRKENRS